MDIKPQEWWRMKNRSIKKALIKIILNDFRFFFTIFRMKNGIPQLLSQKDLQKGSPQPKDCSTRKLSQKNKI